MKKNIRKALLLIMALAVTLSSVAHASELPPALPPEIQQTLSFASAPSEVAACDAVYKKRLQKLHRRDNVATAIGLGGGVTAGTLVTINLISQEGLGAWVVFFGWAASAGAVLIPTFGLYLFVADVVLRDWRKTATVADFVTDASLQLSFRQLVNMGHTTAIRQYEADIVYERRELNEQRAAMGQPPLSVDEVKAIFPMAPLTDDDRAQSVLDRVAQQVDQPELKSEWDYEEFRTKMKRVLYSPAMCPRGKALGTKKALPLLKAVL